MMVTYRYSGPVYSMDDGRAITRKAGEKMAGMIPMLEMPDMLTPNEDGLFPGMSQTWVAQ